LAWLVLPALVAVLWAQPSLWNGLLDGLDLGRMLLLDGFNRTALPVAVYPRTLDEDELRAFFSLHDVPTRIVHTPDWPIKSLWNTTNRVRNMACEATRNLTDVCSCQPDGSGGTLASGSAFPFSHFSSG
jgi:hypothetical protein